MSNLYTQINQEAAKQVQQVEQSRTAEQEQQSKDQPPVSSSSKSPKSIKPTKKRTTAWSNRTTKPNGSVVRNDITNEKSTKASSRSKPASSSLIEEMKHGVEKVERPTERYSFEIYTDQKDKILEIKYQYERRTSKRLPKSRIIREALDLYFDQVIDE